MLTNEAPLSWHRLLFAAFYLRTLVSLPPRPRFTHMKPKENKKDIVEEAKPYRAKLPPAV